MTSSSSSIITLVSVKLHGAIEHPYTIIEPKVCAILASRGWFAALSALEEQKQFQRIQKLFCGVKISMGTAKL